MGGSSTINRVSERWHPTRTRTRPGLRSGHRLRSPEPIRQRGVHQADHGCGQPLRAHARCDTHVLRITRTFGGPLASGPQLVARVAPSCAPPGAPKRPAPRGCAARPRRSHEPRAPDDSPRGAALCAAHATRLEIARAMGGADASRAHCPARPAAWCAPMRRRPAPSSVVPRGAPSTARSRSPASPSARRACPRGCDASPRARTRRRPSRHCGLDEDRAWRAGSWFCPASVTSVVTLIARRVPVPLRKSRSATS